MVVLGRKNPIRHPKENKIIPEKTIQPENMKRRKATANKATSGAEIL